MCVSHHWKVGKGSYGLLLTKTLFVLSAACKSLKSTHLIKLMLEIHIKSILVTQMISLARALVKLSSGGQRQIDISHLYGCAPYFDLFACSFFIVILPIPRWKFYMWLQFGPNECLCKGIFNSSLGKRY